MPRGYRLSEPKSSIEVVILVEGLQLPALWLAYFARTGIHCCSIGSICFQFSVSLEMQLSAIARRGKPTLEYQQPIGASSALCEFAKHQILQLQQMSAMRAATAAFRCHGQGPVCAFD